MLETKISFTVQRKLACRRNYVWDEFFVVVVVVVGVLWQQHCIGRPSRLKRSSVIVKSTSRGLQNTVVEFAYAEHIL